MKADLKEINIKKVLIGLIIVFLAGYVIYDVSLKLVSGFRLQGYQIAVQEIVAQAENEECYPFEIFLGEKKVSLINVNCLQAQGGEMVEEEAVLENE